MNGLSAAILAAAVWSQSGQLVNGNFYILLFIPVAIVVLTCQFRPKEERQLRLLMWCMGSALFLSATFVLCVGFTLLPIVSIA